MHLLNRNNLNVFTHFFITFHAMNKIINLTLFFKSYTKCLSGIIVSTKILSSKTLIIMRRVSWAANQHIRMISEGLCDTETSLCKQQQIYNVSNDDVAFLNAN